MEDRIMNRNSMVIRPVFRAIDYIEKPNTVFVLMPFNEDWSDDVYSLMHKAGNNADYLR